MLIDGPTSSRATVVLTHGAGSPMDTPFMKAIALGLAAAELRVVRFEFSYMAKRRVDGVRRGPGGMPKLPLRWTEILDEISPLPGPLLIGGKSMGGRSAAVFASEPNSIHQVDGVICLGYPFHPPGKPEKTRLEPLRAAVFPTLIVQGERDRFGTPDDVQNYKLRPPVSVHWIADGDHSLVPRKRSGYTETENLEHAVCAITGFVDPIVANFPS